MEILDDLDVQGGSPQKAPRIPVFLKVLCILTFVGAGLGVLGGIIGFFTLSFLENTMAAFSKAIPNSPNTFNSEFENYYNILIWNMILSLLSSIICLVGALIMWKLKRIGYYFYILGQLFGIVALLLGMTAKPIGIGANPFEAFTVAINGFYILVLIGFVIMYGLNFKHLK